MNPLDGVGPMIWAPLSEIPSIGRNPVYSITFLIFVIVSVPTAAVNTFSGLLVLRVIQGFFGSPCLANGGASMADLYSDLTTPYGLTVWVSACFAGPALGPLLSGYAVTAEGWRWSLWEIVWVSTTCMTPIYHLLATHNILMCPSSSPAPSSSFCSCSSQKPTPPPSSTLAPPACAN